MGAGRRTLVAIAAAGLAAAGCTSASSSTSPDSGTSAHAVVTPAPVNPTSDTAPPGPTATAPPRPRPRGVSLPLPFRTGDAAQVITAVAPSTSSTEGVVQGWRKASGGWQRVGPAVHAWFGSDGLTRHASESRSATPIGSFTLTHAFGRLADPGTALPYTQTTPADWWISEPGPLYNTRQRCAADCSFTQGDPNEHLYYTVPFYRYAVVIDYNTRNSPTGVVQGAGSAFFLHVSVGAPTQGCIAVAQSQVIRLLRWLSPARHPRILIGT